MTDEQIRQVLLDLFKYGYAVAYITEKEKIEFKINYSYHIEKESGVIKLINKQLKEKDISYVRNSVRRRSIKKT